MKIYPVMSVRSGEHALRVSERALDVGADGVFLSHGFGVDPDQLTESYRLVREALGREAYVGLNYLGLGPAEAVRHLQERFVANNFPDAILGNDEVAAESGVIEARLHHGNTGNKLRYFGGIALHAVSDPDLAATLAREGVDHLDVAVTRVDGLGVNVAQRKLAAIRSAIGGTELALEVPASCEDVPSYKPYVDSLLVYYPPMGGLAEDASLEDLGRRVRSAHR